MKISRKIERYVRAILRANQILSTRERLIERFRNVLIDSSRARFMTRYADKRETVKRLKRYE